MTEDADVQSVQRHQAAVLAPLQRLAAMGGNNTLVAQAVTAAFMALMGDPPPAQPSVEENLALPSVEENPAQPSVEENPAQPSVEENPEPDPVAAWPSNSAEYAALAEAVQKAPVPLPGDQQANDQTAFQDTVAAEGAAEGPLVDSGDGSPAADPLG